MVGHAGSSIRIVHADMTFTRFKVKATGLLNFRKMPKNWTFLGLSPPPFWRGVQD